MRMKRYLFQTTGQHFFWAQSMKISLRLWSCMGKITKCLRHKTILLCTWLCVRHFSAILPWSSCAMGGQELVWRQFHIMHMSNDLENKQGYVKLRQVSGNIQRTLTHVYPCRGQYHPSPLPSLSHSRVREEEWPWEWGWGTCKCQCPWCLLKLKILATKLNTNVL